MRVSPGSSSPHRASKLSADVGHWGRLVLGKLCCSFTARCDFPLADCGNSTFIVNLSAMSRHSFYAYRVIDEAWLRLSERGKALVLVFSDDSKVVERSSFSNSASHDFAEDLAHHGLRARCAIASTVQDALTFASVNPVWHAFDNEAVNQLMAILDDISSTLFCS